jgi:hypothetical protein
MNSFFPMNMPTTSPELVDTIDPRSGRGELVLNVYVANGISLVPQFDLAFTKNNDFSKNTK